MRPRFSTPLTITLILLASSGLAWLLTRRLVNEREAIRADLMTSQDNALSLTDELTRLRRTAQLQHEALSQPPSTVGGIWLYREGWHSARGPFMTLEQAQRDAEATAISSPGEVIHLLTSTSTVATSSPTPEWEHQRPGGW